MRGLTLACPACGGRGLFTSPMLRIRERCPTCGLRFERIEGHWLGAVALNTVASAAAVLLSVVIAMLVFGTDTGLRTLLAVALPVGVVSPVLFDPFSRTLWTATDMLLRPLTSSDFEERPPSDSSVGSRAHRSRDAGAHNRRGP
ncbi:DUF983 domain-containing protein [Candidatus Poriferisodalis sp.]|uniref:DUF983 domain-containing protein n=1 Tax=Candidatus Poriferisodalis sp. TaxID=3101277 RepID=UPI003B0169FF